MNHIKNESEDTSASEAITVGWQASNGGILQASTKHAKQADPALHWTWSEGSRLRRQGLALNSEETPGAGMEGWVYLEQPLPGYLTFQLGTEADLSAGRPANAFRFNLDFRGWRMFRVLFERDCRQHLEPQAATLQPERPDAIECLEILPPSGTSTASIWLDAVVIGAGISSQRSADFQIPDFSGGLGGWCAHWPLHYARQSPSEPLPDEITATQQHDFARISQRYRKWILGDQPDLGKPLLQAGAEQFQAYIHRGWTELAALKIVRNPEGGIAGPGLVRDFASPYSFKHVFYDILMPIVFDYKINGNERARSTALELFDYIHDQGWAEGSGLGDLWLNPLGFAPYCHAVVLMREDLRQTGRLETAERAAFWYLSFGKSFTRFDEAYIETNADALRSIIFTSLAMILAMEDSPRKVQYMRGWWNWFNDALRISPRFTGLIKPDGLGFHHEGVYAGAYATEAYEFCALIIWLLHGTEFAAAPSSVANLKLALQTQDTLTHHYDVPYATMGRMPRPGIRILSAYAYLALASDPLDADMAGIFMRLWDPASAYLKPDPQLTELIRMSNSSLAVDLDAQGGKFLFYHPFGRLQMMQELADRKASASPKPEGFFSKPWGGLAIHRRDDWMLAVKGWSQYVWDFEMHPKLWASREENVFSRYWSYGTLQPLSHGHPVNPVDSGWNLDRGWNWCRWPGATTKHLSLDENYDRDASWANRFFSTATFVGAVGCEGRNGVFALKLRENFYDPTFRAFKTYHFFDGLVVCLGSNIECRDDVHAIETTLFQSWMPEQASMPVSIDGRAVDDFPFSFQGTPGRPLTLRDPYGHGYFLPDGGAVRLERAVQHSRDAWNLGATEGAFSTAWIDHGHGPREDGYGGVQYHYAMLMHANSEALADLAASPPYDVRMQNHQAHIVEHPGLRTMAYVLFEADWIIPHGLVQRTDTPVMVIVREHKDGTVTLSMADPDLRLPKRRNMGYLDEEACNTPARPSTVHLVLRGNWRIQNPAQGVTLSARKDEAVELTFECRHGLTNEFRLHPKI